MHEIGYVAYGSYHFFSIGMEKDSQIHGQKLVTYVVLFLFIYLFICLVTYVIITDSCVLT